jgi:Bardet-Biedl syndrome 9 protein
MSLFTTKDWWSASIDSDEEFDKGCMCVANIDNEPSRGKEGNDKIITGSFSGLLRIYYPRQPQYRIEDLMIEQNLGMPILQVSAGCFIAGSDELALAVLHPRRLAVYRVGAMGGQGSAASYYSMVKAYEHMLGEDGKHFTSFNFCYGPFGSPNSMRDFICVQSMDGQLQFFEQDQLAFLHRLDEVLIPGPLCYAPQIDALVVTSTNMEVICFKYHVLAAKSSKTGSSVSSGGGNSSGTSGSSGKNDKVHAEWRLNLGEHALDIYIGRYSTELIPGQIDILVHGEHSLFCVTDQGAIRFQKRLNYDVAASTTYNRDGGTSVRSSKRTKTGRTNDDEGKRQHLLVATHTGRLLVYGDTTLLWAAKLGYAPVAVAVANFGGIRGLVVCLDEQGRLAITYMGTVPPSVASSNMEVTSKKDEMDFEAMEREHKQLLDDIRASQNRTEAIAPQEHLIMRAQLPLAPDILTRDQEIDLREHVEDGKICGSVTNGYPIQVTARIMLSLHAPSSQMVRNVQLTISTTHPVTTMKNTLQVHSVKGGAHTPLIIPVPFYCAPGVSVSSLTVHVVAAYKTEDTDQPRVSHLSFRLPYCLCGEVILPTKDATAKMTLDTDKDPVSLLEMFGDLVQLPTVPMHVRDKLASMGANVISFRMPNGGVATVLGSKNAGRYRIQGNSYDTLWLTVAELVLRLRAHFGAQSTDNSLISCADSIPLRDYFSVIEEHFATRKRLAETESTLNDRAQQFRVIQKRLLVRFKSKNPAPLNNMDTLLRVTYQSLQELGALALKTEQELKQSKGKLQCMTEIVLLRMRMQFKLDGSSYEILRSHLSPIVADTTVQGWEECVNAAMMHLLRTVLAKSAKDSASVVQPLKFPSSTTKLQKHLTIVLKRMAAGKCWYGVPYDTCEGMMLIDAVCC